MDYTRTDDFSVIFQVNLNKRLNNKITLCKKLNNFYFTGFRVCNYDFSC